MSSAQRYNRKRVWVHRLIQGRVLSNIAIYWVLYHIVLWHAMFLHRFLQYRDGLIVGQLPVPFAELYGQFVIDHVGYVICAGLVLPIVMWDALCFSHRIVGPLHRIKTSLQQLSSGETTPRIRLRKGDFLGDLADSFNKLRDRIAAEQAFDEVWGASENSSCVNESPDISDSVRDEVITLELASNDNRQVSSHVGESVCAFDSDNEIAACDEIRDPLNLSSSHESTDPTHTPDRSPIESTKEGSPFLDDDFKLLQEIWDLQHGAAGPQSENPAIMAGSEQWP